MSTFYWVNGSGSWDATSTANWSNASGGSSGFGPPTSADDVIFDAGSNTGTNAFTVTVTGTTSAPAVCNDFSTGGAGGALDGAMTLTMGATAVLDCYGSMTLPATNFTNSITSGAVLNFRATVTGKTVTTNGVSLGLLAVTFNGVGGEWTLGSAYTSTFTITVTNGTFNSGNFNITAVSIGSSNSNIRTITLGSSTLTLSASSPVGFTTSTNLTLNAGTSTISCSGTSPTFAGGGQTFYNVSFTSVSAGTTTITGANTFNNLNQATISSAGYRNVRFGENQIVSGTLTLGSANTAVRRMFVSSDTFATQRTITLNGTLATLADVDFRDINVAGTVATPWTGTRLGDCKGNANITFDAPKTVYWNLAGTQNWSATGWATTNNGTPAVNNFPLAQDTATFTEAGSVGTVTINTAWNIGSIQMADGVSNRTTAFTLATSNNIPNIYGNITLFSSLTLTGTGTLSLLGQGTTQTITSAGVSFTQPIAINSPSGTVQLLDNTTVSNLVTLTAGTLDLNDFDLNCLSFASSNSNTRSIDFGTGEINLTGNATTVWNMATATNFTYSGTPTVNATYSGSTGTRTISHGNTSGGTESNAVSFNISTASDIFGFTSLSVAKNVIFSSFSGSFSNGALGLTVYGNLTTSATTTIPSSAATISFRATSGTQQLTTNGITFDIPITQNNPGATLQLQDNLTMGSTRTFTLTAGTLDLSSGNRTLSCGLFSSSNSNTRAIAFGTGQIDVTGNNAGVWNIATATNFTYTGTPKVNFTYSGSTGTRTVATGSTAGGTEANALDFYFTAGTDSMTYSSDTVFGTLDFTGFSGSGFAGAGGFIYRNLVLSSTMTVLSSSTITKFAATSGTQQITTNGKTINNPITIDGVGGTVELQDALTMGSTRTLTLTNGTFNANNYNVTTGLFSSSNTNARTLTMGSGTWTIQGTGSAWNLTDPTNLTLNSNTSTISMTSASAKTFQGGSLAYYNLNQGGAGALTIVGDNTFNNITDSSEPSSILFTAGSTQTVSNFTVSGSPSNLITLASTVPGSLWYLTKTSGTVTVTYCDISDSDANGGATFNCINGVNSGNNTGWNFSSSQFSSGNFLAFF